MLCGLLQGLVALQHRLRVSSAGGGGKGSPSSLGKKSYTWPTVLIPGVDCAVYSLYVQWLWVQCHLGDYRDGSRAISEILSN